MAWKVWLACVILICLSGVGAEEKAENLLKNPDFQNGYGNWITWASADTPKPLGFKVDTSTGFDDSMCIYLQGFPSSGCIFQYIEPVSYSAKYHFRFRFKSEMQTGQARGEIRYQTDKEIRPALWYETREAKWAKSEPISGTLSGWKTCELEISVPADSNIKRIVPFISVSGQSPNDKFYIDAVEFYVVK